MVDFTELSKEYIKCYSDTSRIYMIQNYLKTFDGTQGLEVPFELFPKQQELCHALGDSENSVATTKYRQAGITTVTAGFISCDMSLCDKESPKTALIIGNTLDLAQEMLFKIQNFLLQIPLWFWGPEYWEGLDDVDIMEPPSNPNIIFKKCNGKVIFLKNGCKIYARSSGPNASRGISACHYLIFDETAFIENGGEVYTSALPTTSSVKGKAIFVSTPNGKDPLYYETCRRAKLKGTKDWNGFDLVEMHWYQDLRYNRFLEWTKKNPETGEIEIIKEKVLNEKGTIPYDEERWEKLIKDGWKPRSPWYVRMCRQFNNDPQKIAQELDVSFLGSDSTVIPPELIEMQRNLNVKEPAFVDSFLDDLWIWKQPIPGHRYIMSIDGSSGAADDATALEISDMDGIDDNGMPCVEQVLEYNGKLTGDVIAPIAYQYGLQYNQAYIIVECIGGYGDAIILSLMDMKYPNLYYDDPTLKKYTSQNDASTLKATENGLPGFRSSSMRIQMLANFANLVKTNQYKIRSKRVCAELDTWVFKNGRIDHKDGCHDDTLTCLAMGMFVMEFSLVRQMKAKEMDSTMLRAMIQVNTPKVNEAPKPQVKKFGNNVPIQMLFSKGAMNSVAEKYRANMWLFN